MWLGGILVTSLRSGADRNGSHDPISLGLGVVAVAGTRPQPSILFGR